MQLASLFSVQNLLGTGSYRANGTYEPRERAEEGFADPSGTAVEKSSNYNCYDGGRRDTPGTVKLFNGWDFACVGNTSCGKHEVTVARIPKEKTKDSALTLTRDSWSTKAKGSTGAWIQIGSKTLVTVTKYFDASNNQVVTKTFKTGPTPTVDRVRIMSDTINKMFKDDSSVKAISFQDAKNTDGVTSADLAAAVVATTLDITSADLIKQAGAPETTTKTIEEANQSDKPDASGNKRPDIRNGVKGGFVGLKLSEERDAEKHLTISGLATLAVCPSGNFSQRVGIKLLGQHEKAGCLDQTGQYVEFGAFSTKIDELTVGKGTKVRIELVGATGQIIETGRLHAYGDKAIFIINKTSWGASDMRDFVAQVKKKGVVTVRVTVLSATDSFRSMKKDGALWLDAMYASLLGIPLPKKQSSTKH